MPESSKFTKMEREALEAQRQGKRITAEQQEVPDGPPVVTLKEFAEKAMPVPPGAPAATLAPSPEKPMNSQDQVSPADLESLKKSVFDPPSAPDASTPAETDAPIEGDSEDASDAGVGPDSCPRCGWDLSKDVLDEPTEADKLEFVESLLGSRRFMRPVNFIGGKIEATYRTVTVEEEDAINDYINGKIDRESIRNPEDWQLWYTRCRLVMMLDTLTLGTSRKKFKEVNAANFPPVESIKDDIPLQRALREVPTKWPVTIHAMLIQGMITVDNIYSILMSRINDPNFWERPAET